MAKLKGILKQNVTVEVNAKECFMALAEELGFIELFKTERDEFFILLPPTDTEPPYMVCKKNTCYHGSPDYEEVSRKKLTIEEYKCGQALIDLEQAYKVLQ